MFEIDTDWQINEESFFETYIEYENEWREEEFFEEINNFTI